MGFGKKGSSGKNDPTCRFFRFARDGSRVTLVRRLLSDDTYKVIARYTISDHDCVCIIFTVFIPQFRYARSLIFRQCHCVGYAIVSDI